MSIRYTEPYASPLVRTPFTNATRRVHGGIDPLRLSRAVILMLGLPAIDGPETRAATLPSVYLTIVSHNEEGGNGLPDYLANVDASNIGVETSSFGIAIGAGALGRYPNIPVSYL